MIDHYDERMFPPHLLQCSATPSPPQALAATISTNDQQTTILNDKIHHSHPFHATKKARTSFNKLQTATIIQVKLTSTISTTMPCVLYHPIPNTLRHAFTKNWTFEHFMDIASPPPSNFQTSNQTRLTQSHIFPRLTHWSTLPAQKLQEHRKFITKGYVGYVPRTLHSMKAIISRSSTLAICKL